MANMRRSRTGDWSVVIGPGLGLLYIFVYIFSSSSLVRVVANLRRCLHYHISDHISTEGGHAEHVLVTRISNKMDTSSTDKQIFECSKCPRSVEFRSAICIGSASG